MIGRVIVHIHPIKWPGNIVLGTSQLVCCISNYLILGILDAPRINIFQALKIPHFESFTLLLEYPWPIGWLRVLVDYLKLFTLSNLDMRVVNARIFVSFGSIIVHYFDATMIFLFCFVLDYVSCLNLCYSAPLIFGEIDESVES